MRNSNVSIMYVRKNKQTNKQHISTCPLSSWSLNSTQMDQKIPVQTQMLPVGNEEEEPLSSLGVKAMVMCYEQFLISVSSTFL